MNAQDSHDTRILHPAIKIAKTGPAEKLAGDKLDYGLVVTNPGDVVFARDNVVVTDPGCDSTPALIAKYHPTAADPAAADPTPDQLDPGDAWAYTCSYQSAKTETSHVNTAFVVGTDPNGHVLKDQSTVTTKLDQIAVLPEKATPGASRLVAPEGCTKSSFTAKVTGKEIAQVTFFLDGKKVKRLKGKSGQLVFKLKLSTQGRSYGVHRVRAKVIYTAKSLTKSKSMLVTFQRCAKQVVKPQFTG